MAGRYPDCCCGPSWSAHRPPTFPSLPSPPTHSSGCSASRAGPCHAAAPPPAAQSARARPQMTTPAASRSDTPHTRRTRLCCRRRKVGCCGAMLHGTSSCAWHRASSARAGGAVVFHSTAPAPSPTPPSTPTPTPTPLNPTRPPSAVRRVCVQVASAMHIRRHSTPFPPPCSAAGVQVGEHEEEEEPHRDAVPLLLAPQG